MPPDLEVTDLMLMQLADGELDRDMAQRVRAAMADDPEMRERFARFAATRAATQQAFDAVLRAPVPTGLIQSVLAADTASAPPARRSQPRMPGWLAWLRAHNAAGYAGWAVAGVALAVLALPPEAPAEIRLGQAGPALAGVLETQPSGQPVRQGRLSLVPLATHPARGTHCRDFAADGSRGQTLGVACRETDGWSVVAAVTLPGGQGARPASADDPLLGALLERMDAGAPLSAEAEAALMRRGWR